MQNEVTFIIAEGKMTYLLTKAAPRLAGAVVRRASHVEPVNTYLRLAFQVIRKLVSDDSRIAAWSRLWPCLWRVDMSPVGGGIIPVHFSNRLAAIDAEVEALNNHFTWRKYEY
jgi:hypothetical protein